MSFKKAIITTKQKLPTTFKKRHEQHYCMNLVSMEKTINRVRAGTLRLGFFKSSFDDEVVVKAVDVRDNQELVSGMYYGYTSGTFKIEKLLNELAKAVGARVEYDR